MGSEMCIRDSGSSITASIRDVVNYFNAGVWILERLCDVVERVE